jgi:hypothetical protein
MARGPKWRVFTWVILVINVLFLIWVIAGGVSASKNCNGLTGSELQGCQAGTAVGASIGIGIIIFLWALVDVILGVLWLVTKPRRRTCPACGNEVKRGLTRCPNCGFDFAAAAAQGRAAIPPPPPPPTVPDSP